MKKLEIAETEYDLLMLEWRQQCERKQRLKNLKRLNKLCKLYKRVKIKI
jgi:hypothetical protein